MTGKTACFMACGLLASAGAAWAQGPADIHIPGGRSQSFTWTVNDGKGFRWDIYQNGQVSNGTNSAYSGGMTLYVNGSSFSWGSDGRASPDGREVEVGPWQNGPIQVWRRIYVSPKESYCRWIDIFQNAGGSPVDLQVEYRTHLGSSIAQILTASGGQQWGKDDWAMLTAPAGGGSRPVVCHVYSSKGAALTPEVRATTSNNQVSCQFRLNVPAGKTVALCAYQSQQTTLADAQEFLRRFRPASDLRNTPASLRKLILNMRGLLLAVGQMELPRDDQQDLAVLRRNGGEMLGTIQEKAFAMETSYGKLDLPAEKVVGLSVSPESPSLVRLALADGQVVGGRLLTDPLHLKLQTGSEVTLQVENLSSLAYRVSPQRPEEIPLRRPALLTRGGQRAYFQPSDVDCSFLSEYGELKVRPEDLLGIYMDTPEGGLHRAVFRNGSVLSGLLLQKHFKLHLELGPTLELEPGEVRELVFPAAEIPSESLAEVRLRNEDVLYGRVLQDSLEVKTRHGLVRVAPRDLKELKLLPGTMDSVEISLHDGTHVAGQFVGRTVRFQVQPGPEIPLFIGHVVSLTCPAPPPTSASAPADANLAATRAAPVPLDGAAGAEATPDPRRTKEAKERIASLAAAAEAAQKQAADLQARIAQLVNLGRKEEAARLKAQVAEVLAQADQTNKQLEIERERLAELQTPRR